jgi:hypothetical protein
LKRKNLRFLGNGGFSIPKGGKEPGADDQSAPGPFRKEKRGKKMKVESNYEA